MKARGAWTPIRAPACFFRGGVVGARCNGGIMVDDKEKEFDRNLTEAFSGRPARNILGRVPKVSNGPAPQQRRGRLRRD